MTSPLQRIKAGIIDGRCRTPRYIQKQLLILHDALAYATPSFHEAIISDTECSSAEAWFEIHMTLHAVKQQYGSINFDDCLQQEYSIVKGKDNASRRLPFGCVYILPSQHSRLYSVIQPSAAAIAAGNCVVIEMRQRLLKVEKLLRDIIHQNMDKDTFVIVDQKPPQHDFFSEQTVIAAGEEQDHYQYKPSKLLKSPSSRAIAVVDRSANIPQAAKDIVRARFQFRGKSPYAPDLVLVNEFALKDFCQEAIRCLTQELSEVANFSSKSKIQAPTEIQKQLQSAGATTLVSGARGSVQLLRSKDNLILSEKINEPLLLVIPISSLDDAIDTANTSDSSLLAAYFFADAKAAKYLSQFVMSDVSLTNHIPPQLLVGPPAPRDHPISFHLRYTKDMFSIPSPEFTLPLPSLLSSSLSDKDILATKLLDQRSVSKADIEKLRLNLQAPLPDMKQPAGKSIGFFEQGLFTGVVIEATILLSLVAVSARYAVPAIIKRIRV